MIGYGLGLRRLINTKWFLYFWVSVALATVFPFPIGASEPQTLEFDLEACLEYALKHHPSLRAAEARKTSAWLLVEAERAEFLPKLDLSAESGLIYGEPTGPFVLSKGVDVQKIDYFGRYYSTDLILNFPIFKQGVFMWEDPPSILRLEGIAEREGSLQGVIKEKIIYEASIAFSTALKNTQTMTATESIFRFRQQDYEQTLKKFNNSLISRQVLLSVDVQLAESLKDLRSAKNVLSFSIADLAAKIGLSPTTNIILINKSAADLLIPDLEKLINLSYRLRPEIGFQEAKIKTARAGLGLTRAERYPSVDVVSSYGFGDDFEFPMNSSWLTSLQLKMPLLDFGGIRTRVSGAKATVMEQENLLFNVKNTVALEVIQGYTDILNAEAEIALSEKRVEQAEESLKSARAKFEIDLAIRTDVLEAESFLLLEKNNLYQSKFERGVGIANLRKAVGGDWL